MQSEFDKELQSYFTDMEHLREMFKQWLAAPALPKRILVVHGVGGVGKSSLLRMLRLHCKSVGVPVALASGDDAKSALDVLTRWADDLKADGIALPAFSKTFAQYRALQAKVENEAAKAAGKVTKEAAKTLVETAASTIPGLGPLVGKLGGMGAEALTDWLFSRGFKKPDVDLLLDPAKKLTEDFLADIVAAAEKKRLTLMLDTFEQMTALEDWTREMAQRLPPNVLLVIAGRIVPSWDRAWHGWMANAQVEELKPMDEDKMRELIRRYYATLLGGEPDPKQVDAIIAFARGLPMVATSVVRAWVQYPDTAGDFQAVKTHAVADFVDYLFRSVPGALVPVLEAAAAVRWFDQPILRAVLQREDVRDAYNELRRFPFVRPRAEGPALHDAVRDLIDENLRVQDAERHRELHERAAAYFEKRLEKATGEEAERLSLERLYHRIRADEEAGIKLFQEMAEELVRYRLVNRLRALLNDVNTYPLERENSRLWRKYYNAGLAHLEARFADAEKVYQAIGENEKGETRLIAYALCDWGWILKRREYLYKAGGIEKAIYTLQRSLDLTPLDQKLARSLIYLSDVYTAKAEYQKAMEFLEQAQEFFSERNDFVGIIEVLLQERGIYGRQHNFKELLKVQQQIWKAYNDAGAPPYWQPRCAAPVLDLIWMGRYADGEKERSLGLKSARAWEDYELTIWHTRDLGFVLGMQGKCAEALQLLDEGLGLAQTLGKIGKLEVYIAESLLGITLLKCGDLTNAEQFLTNALTVGQELHTHLDHGLLYSGTLYEMLLNWEKAEHFYVLSRSEAHQLGRYYFECGALTGLTRVKHAQGDYAAIPPLLAEAEQLAQQYEYNDHLASLRLTQGHIAWEGAGQVSNLSYGFDAALHYYQHALIYALRYNRFLLDEVLSGRPQGTPLRPIIPECLKRGEEGRRMLIALREWWKTGVNDIGTPRPDTISPIPEGIALLEAERIAREREPGDGSPQTSVAERIEKVLQEMGAG